MWAVASLAGIAGIAFSPFPVIAKVLALVPLVMTFVAIAVEECMIAVAGIRAAQAADTAFARAYFDRIAGLPDAEWEQVVEPIERRRLRPIPLQRRAGAGS